MTESKGAQSGGELGTRAMECESWVDQFCKVKFGIIGIVRKSSSMNQQLQCFLIMKHIICECMLRNRSLE